MNRRSMLGTIVKPIVELTPSASPPTGNLAPYSGPWTEREAKHLLRRTVFGLTFDHLSKSLSLGLDQSIESLTESLPAPAPPLNYDFEGDPDVPIGATWVNALHSTPNNSNNYRIRSMRGWLMERIFSGEFNIREKMTLFWHNHFPTADINDARFQYGYLDLLRTNCLGNFKELTKQMTLNPAMLRYLNGNQNTKRSPNENYARELLELFTIGKGPIAGPGDYTNFTEDDVREIAKILTGWRDVGYRSATNPIGVQFRSAQHDTTTKVLSHRFGNVAINNNGEQEYKELIDVIFNQDEVSRFIARKLYRWFVYYKIDDTIESTIIEPLASIIRDNDYDMLPAIKVLLSSEHFYDDANVGCMIKNPIDFITSLMTTFNVAIPTSLNERYRYLLRIYNTTINLQMVYLDPPNVAGWKAYYQEPVYYQIWLNSVTMPLRKSISDVVLSVNIFGGDDPNEIGFIPFIEQIADVSQVDVLIKAASDLLFSKPITEEQLAVLQDILIPGLPAYEWTIEYNEYKANPTNQLRNAIENKLKNLFIYMGRMPEFQLS